MARQVSSEELEAAVRRTNQPFAGGAGFVMEKKGAAIFSQFPERGQDGDGQPTLKYRVGTRFFDEESGLEMEAHVVITVARPCQALRTKEDEV